MIKIDGSFLEGGGQIVRTAVAFSVLTNTAVKIVKIRKGRSKPGLKNQHLNAINALAELSNATVIGARLGSTSLEFFPRQLIYRNLNIDIGTAGSITLLFQALMPVLLFSNKIIKIGVKGGTDTKYSMPIDYFKSVFLPQLSKYAKISCKLEKRGYYPKGGGKFELTIKPKYSIRDFKSFSDFFKFLRSEENRINLIDQNELVLIKGVSHASKDLMKANVAERQAKNADYLLGQYKPVKIEIGYVDSLSVGSGVTLWAIFSQGEEVDPNNPVILGADSLGEKRKKAEIVGQDAANNIIKLIKSEAAVDKYLADQLLPYMALFGGQIKVSEITNHTKTNMKIIEEFIDMKFKKRKNIIRI
jgi:RNA 3'-terminal phosphate cyclase (GTP)